MRFLGLALIHTCTRLHFIDANAVNCPINIVHLGGLLEVCTANNPPSFRLGAKAGVKGRGQVLTIRFQHSTKAGVTSSSQ